MSAEALKFKNSVFFVVSFTILLWIIKALEWAVALDFGFLGILPRTLSGTMGIITAPLIHGDVLHLISNTFPLLLLGVSVFYFYHRIAIEVFAWIYFLSGFWVWMAARDAYHIGASGLIYGMVAFLFFSGLFRRDTKSLSISLIVIFLYGGMLQGLFPTNGRISWESHLLGALAGGFCAFFYREVKIFEKSKNWGAEAAPVVQSASILPFGEEEQEPDSRQKAPTGQYAVFQEAVDTYPLNVLLNSGKKPEEGAALKEGPPELKYIFVEKEKDQQKAVNLQKSPPVPHINIWVKTSTRPEN